ncbi:TetR/AcrR family transcriptional regulator [Sinomonas sp. ASV322]|uniref:TetR/AcrR family transcriptional regulator n=1 Tax=Sinomonas sp. ASV322 TaxID=3041920 RepID=UPI0027DC6D64|nr:TetR/AcrR family transcriptional regulator [Sinomonas sp. ASV322]MDQ4501003.1 TetR/AcrR family transcriptional regulator [Sinomonas sp. ASV322]
MTTAPDYEAAGRRSRTKGEARRRQILDSAIELFAERGVDAASLRSIGEAIGVSHTALRHYFASRDELLVEVYRAHEASTSEGIRDVESDPVRAMAATAERNRSIPGLVQLYTTLTTDAIQEQHPQTQGFVRERFRSLRGAIAGQIKDGQEAGTIAAGLPPEDVAALIIAASDGLQIQWLLDPEAVDVGRVLSLLEQLLPPHP